MRIIFHLLLFLAFFPILLFSNGRKYHRFHIGTEVLYHDFKEKFFSPATVHEYGLMKGIVAGYDYIHPSGLYAGADYYHEKSDVHDTNQDNSDKISSDNKRDNYEGRIGLNIGLGKLMFIPFGGYGYHQWTRKVATQDFLPYSKLHYKWEYVAYGVRTLILFQYVDIGFYITFLEMIKAEVKVFGNDNKADYQLYQESRRPTFDYKNSCHFVIEVPFYFHPSGRYSFDLGLIPFFRDTHLRKKNELKFFQSDLIFGPSSQTYDLGARIELGIYF